METVSPNVEVLSRKRKRSGECDSSDNELHQGMKRWFYVLASEDSEELNSDDIETVYSLQDKTTDFVVDTEDTLSDCSFSASTRMVEFEVASLTEEDEVNYGPPDYQSSEPQDVIRINLEVEDDLDDEGKDDAYHSTLGSNCWQCSRPKTNQYFTLCDNCFKTRRRFLPPRPRRKRNHQEDSQGSSSAITSGYGGSSQELGIINEVKEAVESLSTEGEGVTCDSISRQEMCQACLVHPRNGGFLHRINRIVHIYACYYCSQRIWRRNGRCPICNLQADDIMRVINP